MIAILKIAVFALVLLSLWFAYQPTFVLAIESVDFPACPNPGGTLKVKYDSGRHGIVGDGGTFTGSDAVYSISADTFAQCFCAENGSGIQTNWWKASGLSVEEVDSLVAAGWKYVPSGSVWGLTDDPYLAKNDDFSCNGSVLAAVSDTWGEVLGLAATGSAPLLYFPLLFGAFMVFLGVVLWYRTSR